MKRYLGREWYEKQHGITKEDNERNGYDIEHDTDHVWYERCRREAMPFRVCPLGARPFSAMPFDTWADARKWAVKHFGIWDIWNWNGNTWDRKEQVANI